MILNFSKMHGLGNDFVVFDATQARLNLTTAQLQYIADRHFGVGCDQVLMVEQPRSDDTEFYYRIFNADGSEVEQCGNGARCFARFVCARGLTSNTILHVGTASGKITLYLQDDDQVRVNMGTPAFEPAAIPLLAEQLSPSYSVSIDGENIEFMAVSMGNPHAVISVDDVNQAPVNTLGPLLESHEIFPQRVNVGFMSIVDRQHINLRVYERGSGETLACGTGACAAVVAGQNRGWLDDEVVVSLPGGELTIGWQGQGQPAWMTGPATFVFEGVITL